MKKQISYRHLKDVSEEESDYSPVKRQITKYSKFYLNCILETMDKLARTWAGVLTVEYQSETEVCDFTITIQTDEFHFYTTEFIELFAELLNSADSVYIERCSDNSSDMELVVIQSNGEDVDAPFFGNSEDEEFIYTNYLDTI